MDIYSTRAQLAAIEQQPREYSFLYDLFVQEKGCVEDNKAIYDYRKGTRRMAPIVHENTGGILMERDGYETREIDFCTIAPERIITNPDLAGRAFGEKILGAMTPEQREKKMLIKDQIEMRRAIQRRREWMARQVLLTGKLSVFRYTNEGRDLHTTMVADYGFTNTFTPATAWGQTGADIEGDMQTVFDMVYDGGGYADVILMDPEAARVMLSDSKYMKQFDGRNIDMGTINTRYKGAGIRFIGWNSDGVEMYTCAALGAALKKGLEIFCGKTEQGLDVLLRAEKMPEWRLDEMAWELGCLYDYGAEISMKREWIRNAVPLYASYGTAEAIYKYLGGYFENVQVEEWWQYGAEGYHFRVIVAGQWTKKSADWAREAIEKVKNVRSVLDYLAVGSEIKVMAAAETDYTRFTCPMAGEIAAGVYPGEDL